MTVSVLWLFLTFFISSKADVVEAFNSTSRYLDDLLSIDNSYFEETGSQIYPTVLQLNLGLSLV